MFECIVGILTFMNKKNFMLSWTEHEIFFITSGPGLNLKPSQQSDKLISRDF